MEMAALLTVERVALGIEAKSKKRALEMVSEVLSRDLADLGQSAVFTSLVGRERLGSTAIGHGVALPHGRIDGISNCLGAFIRLQEPIDFEGAGDAPVDMMFGLLVPKVCGEEHLAALAAIATCFDDAALREALRAAESEQAAFELLTSAGDSARA